MSAKAKAERDRKAAKAEKVKVKRDRKAALSEIALRIKAVDINGKPMFYDEQMSRSRSFYDTKIELSNVGYFDDKDRYHEAFSECHASSDRKTYE